MNILICAVGGQGALLASKIIGKLAQNMNLDVKASEVHGMSQRGGSVVTYVRYGENVYSPIIEKGAADIILAFEELEARRYIDYLKPNGTLIVNTQKINPMPVITGASVYPDNIINELKQLPIKVIDVDAVKIAKELNEARVVNTILIGILAKSSNIKKEKWIEALEDTVPKRALEVNIKAFELGYEI